MSSRRAEDLKESRLWEPHGLSDVLSEIEKKKGELNSLMIKLEELKGQTLIFCESNYIYGEGCGQTLMVNTVVYLIQMWYTPPSGCTEGDYWNEGDGEFICPHCGHRNRMYYRKDVMALRRFFKEVKKEYPKNG